MCLRARVSNSRAATQSTHPSSTPLSRARTKCERVFAAQHQDARLALVLSLSLLLRSMFAILISVRGTRCLNKKLLMLLLIRQRAPRGRFCAPNELKIRPPKKIFCGARVLIDLLGNKVIKRAHATAPVLSLGFYQRRRWRRHRLGQQTQRGDE
jgi:hypothetical protein